MNKDLPAAGEPFSDNSLSVGAAKAVGPNEILKLKTQIPDISDNEYWNYCDNCGTRLEAFRCRYVCPKCGFFHSCSEP